MDKLKIYTGIVLYWVLVMNLVSYFALISVISFIEITGLDMNSLNNPLADYWVSTYQLLEATLFGTLFGVLFIATNELSEKLKIERLSFGRAIVVKSASS